MRQLGQPVLNTLYQSPFLAAIKLPGRNLHLQQSKNLSMYLYQSNKPFNPVEVPIFKNVYREAKPDGRERGTGGDKKYSDKQTIEYSDNSRRKTTMKKLFKPRTETIEFKTFCSSGSPEFIAAKKKVNDLFKEQQKNSPYHRRTITAYSLYLNPLALFDVHFMLAAGAVVLIAVLEKKLAENGIEFAAILSGFLHVAFPLVAFGSLLVLISKLGVFP